MSSRPGGTAPDEVLSGLHPAFRILLLLVLAGMLFRYSLAAIALVLASLLLAAAVAGSATLRAILKSLRRIRWLLLSIVVIYLWVAPEPAVAGRPGYLPSWGELEIALQRSGVLLVLVVAVELLRHRAGAQQVAAGLVMLLRPLALFGVRVEVFARRLALTLEAVPVTAERVARAAGGREKQRGFTAWGEAAAALLQDIERDAVTAPRRADLPALAPPGLRDWLLLVAGIGACLLAGML